jgi:nicotinamidase-related amidase
VSIRRPIAFKSLVCIESDANLDNASSFSNTDLEYQLRQHDVTHVVIAGLVTNSCVESTARAAREL